MTSIVPTVTAETSEAYNWQLEEVRGFACRVHIDLMDGMFAPTTSVDFGDVWWPGNIRADLHVMFRQPFKYTEMLRALAPQMVIVHAEALGDFEEFASYMHLHGIEVGVALLPITPVSTIAPAVSLIDHVLVFSGNLGYQGGSTADMKLLGKVHELRELKPTLEIGWDGGVNDKNAKQIADAGVDVLNVGGFMRKGKNPAAQFALLQKALGN